MRQLDKQTALPLCPDGREQECLYDGEGLRAGVKGNDCAATFLFHNGEILTECDGEGLPVRRHLTSIGLYGVEDTSTGTGHTYHRDEQGSTVYVTGITGETENLYSYDGFGNILESREGIRNRIRYTGQQYDQETGQYYLRARYYNPVTGRFTQEDTYRGDGLNLYAYCDNNPLMYYDPSGHNMISSLFGGCENQGGQNENEQTQSQRVQTNTGNNNKQPGSYTIEFESGMKYHGKGPESRMEASAKYRSEQNNDPVKSKNWTPSNNDKDAFIDEFLRMQADGGYDSPTNYNVRQSPGKKYLEQKNNKK